MQWASLWEDLIAAFYTNGGVLLNKTHDVAWPTGISNTGLLRNVGDTNAQATVFFDEQEGWSGPAGRGDNDFVGTAEVVET